MSGVVRYDQLYGRLRSRIAPGCGEGVMLQALRESGRKFCEQTGAWRENMTPITTVADQQVYTVVNQWSADIIAINRVGLRTADEIADDADADGTEIYCGSYTFHPGRSELRFLNGLTSSAVTDGLLVNVSLVPRYEADEIAEWLVNMYADGILAGATEIICSMPDTKFYNEKASRRAGKTFNNEACRATLDASKSFTSQPYRITGGYNLL